MQMKVWSLLSTGLACLMLPTAIWAETVWVGRFSAGDPDIPEPWVLQHLSDKFPPTRYLLRQWDGVVAIEATAVRSMALLGRTLTVDLQKTPILCWLWRVDAPLKSADLAKKSGDDYAARVYLTFTVPPDQLGFGTRAKLSLARSIYGNQVPDAALNYVWDNRYPVGTVQDNAYTDRVRMWVLRTGAEKAGTWVQERRNLALDFAQAFGGIHGRLTGLALASDTDNTGEDARAGFADFRLVSSEMECPAPSF
ncbi:MAG: DUF3047 domain-containing protein [Rhodoferax sp.]|nr:DUF3047 domain-containing protein [Rhodoferax sp.]